MELTTFREQLESVEFVRRTMPAICQDFCELLSAHGEVQLDMASGKKYSVHLGDMGRIEDGCLTVRLFDGRIVRMNWEQVENVWIHLANDEG